MNPGQRVRSRMTGRKGTYNGPEDPGFAVVTFDDDGTQHLVPIANLRKVRFELRRRGGIR